MAPDRDLGALSSRTSFAELAIHLLRAVSGARVDHSMPDASASPGKLVPGVAVKASGDSGAAERWNARTLSRSIHPGAARTSAKHAPWWESCDTLIGTSARGGTAMLLVLINILIIVVVGALLFYLIDKFVRDSRLANLLKILVALICLAAILQRLLPALGISGLL